MRKPLPFLTKFAKDPFPSGEHSRQTEPNNTTPPPTIRTRVNPETTDDA